MNHSEYIKSRVQQHARASDIFRELRDKYGEANAPSRTTVFYWAARFRGGRNRLAKVSEPKILPFHLHHGLHQPAYDKKSSSLTQRREVRVYCRDYANSRSKQGTSAWHIYRELNRMFGEITPAYKTIKRWTREMTSAVEQPSTSNQQLDPSDAASDSMPSSTHATTIGNMLYEQGGAGVPGGHHPDEMLDEPYVAQETIKELGDIWTTSDHMNSGASANGTLDQNGSQNTTMNNGYQSMRNSMATSQQVTASSSYRNEARNSGGNVGGGGGGGAGASPGGQEGRHLFVAFDNGFRRGLEPERIADSFVIGDQRFFVMKWKNSSRKDLGE